MLSWLIENLVSLLQLFRILSSSAPSSSLDPEENDQDGNLVIFVKLGSGRRIPIHIESDWTIFELKKEIQRKSGFSTDLQVIFQGKSLEESVKIASCDLGFHSILDVVEIRDHSFFSNEKMKKKKNEMDALKKEIEVEEEIENIQYEEEEKDKTSKHLTSSFFVVCSSCSSVTQGKLRVRCMNCRSGALLLIRQPSSWNDVLTKGILSASCESCQTVSEAQFYFKCKIHGTESSPLHLLKVNYQEIPCLACLEISSPILVFSCSHVICSSCFSFYGHSKLNERKFVYDSQLGYSLGCPLNCDSSLISEPKHFKLLTPSDYSRYQRFAAEEFLYNSGGVICPQPHCGLGISLDESCERKITCEPPFGCGFVFCRDCNRGYHNGNCLDSDEDESDKTSESTYSQGPKDYYSSESKWKDPSISVIKLTCKPCPQCQRQTERSGGCMHMICPICDTQWCWMCQTAWSRNCQGNHWFG